MVLAFWETYRRSEALPPPSWQVVGIASILILAGLFCAGKGWAALFWSGHDWRLIRGLFAAQLAKYIPGGIWQPASQIASATRTGASIPVASAALTVHSLVQIVAAGTVGGGLVVVASRLPAFIRILSLTGLLATITLNRRWMVRLAAFIGGVLKRAPAEGLIPEQSQILRCFAWSMGTFVLSGLAFALLADSVGVTESFLVGTPAFALAWAVGFLAIIVPAGLGVREALLVVLLGPGIPASLVIAASVVHRLITMGAEAAMFGLSLLLKGSPQDAGEARSRRSL